MDENSKIYSDKWYLRQALILPELDWRALHLGEWIPADPDDSCPDCKAARAARSHLRNERRFRRVIFEDDEGTS